MCLSFLQFGAGWGHSVPCELGALMNLRVVGFQFVQLFYIVGMSDDFQAPLHSTPETRTLQGTFYYCNVIINKSKHLLVPYCSERTELGITYYVLKLATILFCQNDIYENISIFAS